MGVGCSNSLSKQMGYLAFADKAFVGDSMLSNETPFEMMEATGVLPELDTPHKL